MKVLSWNVRGLGSPIKKAIVKEVIRGSKADIVLLQETKLSSMSNSTIKDVCGSASFDWVCRDVCSAGGILVFCNRRAFVIKKNWVGVFSVTARVQDLATNSTRIVSSVYGPNDKGRRVELWSELDSVRSR